MGRPVISLQAIELPRNHKTNERWEAFGWLDTLGGDYPSSLLDDYNYTSAGLHRESSLAVAIIIFGMQSLRLFHCYNVQ